MDPREALRHELEGLGLDVASDTLAARGELYVRAENDLAAAVFEFKPGVAEAIETMYQGRWVEGLPPRFAVLPASASAEPSFELLEQMRIEPLLYEEADGRIAFIDLEAALAKLRR